MECDIKYVIYEQGLNAPAVQQNFEMRKESDWRTNVFFATVFILLLTGLIVDSSSDT